MSGAPLDHLSRRERQIMEIIYAVGAASAADVQSKLEDAPGYSAVRSALRLLEKKGLLVHRREGMKYVFEPKVSGVRARQGALRRVVSTFFRNSAVEAVQTLLSDKDLQLSDRELGEIEKLLKEARRRK
jgi:BlaI family transcriptional regulator, penicillinase repressor